MDIITFIYSGLRVILGFAILLFIPGFLLSLVFFPKISDLRLSERLVYSCVLSIGSVIIYVLFMDSVLGIDTTPINIIIVLTGFSLLLAILWIIRRFFLNFSLTEKISIIVKKAKIIYDHSVGERIKEILDRNKNKTKDPPNNDDPDREF